MTTRALTGARGQLFEAATELDLGDGSSVSYLPGHLSTKQASAWFEALDASLPWERPEIFVRGRKSLQPRETFYIAEPGLKPLKYSGHEPKYHLWEDFPLLNEIRAAVCEAVPGHAFNSCLVNRYADGDASVAWHSDAEKLFGIAPTIASLSLGAPREFLVRRKVSKRSRSELEKSGRVKRLKSASLLSAEPQPEVAKVEEIRVDREKHSFSLDNGDLFVMRGNMQRDWEHAVPRRKAVKETRLSLTFRTVIERVSSGT